MERGPPVPLLLFPAASPAPELTSKMSRFFFLSFFLSADHRRRGYKMQASHLVLHGPRKYSSFKLQGDRHSNLESVNLACRRIPQRAAWISPRRKVKEAFHSHFPFPRVDASVTLNGCAFDVSHASLPPTPLWPSEPTCSIQQLVLASLSFYLSQQAPGHRDPSAVRLTG